ncbi:MAG: cytosolic protein [Nitrospirae bacterium]|nr:cytosolic protein [Nitrospirota bacterium]
MKELNVDIIRTYVEYNIGVFHEKRIYSLAKLKLNQILMRKNPYLFKAKNILTAQDLVKTLLDAYLSSQEETIFGEFLEGLAVFICAEVYGGKKSAAEGIDLEFDKDDIKYIVTIKSGPNWGNSSQINKMKDNFKKAKKILSTNTSKTNIVSVNGCCYGRDSKPDKGDYLKLCGQRFWEFISGNNLLYITIIEPLGYKAKVKNDEFYESYARLINEFTFEFGRSFCSEGKINWEALLKFNSSALQ